MKILVIYQQVWTTQTHHSQCCSRRYVHGQAIFSDRQTSFSIQFLTEISAVFTHNSLTGDFSGHSWSQPRWCPDSHDTFITVPHHSQWHWQGREYRRRLKITFDEAGISIPFAQQGIWLHDTQLLHPDASTKSNSWKKALGKTVQIYYNKLRAKDIQNNDQALHSQSQSHCQTRMG